MSYIFFIHIYIYYYYYYYYIFFSIILSQTTNAKTKFMGSAHRTFYLVHWTINTEAFFYSHIALACSIFILWVVPTSLYKSISKTFRYLVYGHTSSRWDGENKTILIISFALKDRWLIKQIAGSNPFSRSHNDFLATISLDEGVMQRLVSKSSIYCN